MDDNDRYYQQHADTFFKGTVGVDMAPLYRRFLPGLPAGAHILDAGCGSGRDARAFAQMGYRVSAFDASPELARRASDHSGLNVEVRRFDDVSEVAHYDAIWCCASLLHVPQADMPDTLARLWRALRPGGRLYASFKHGRGERDHGGRRFTDADEATVRDWVAGLAEVSEVETWMAESRLPGREDIWVNLLATRR